MYGSFVYNARPEKANPNHTRFVAGGDQGNGPYKVATPTAKMLVAKILFNSVISMPGACFMTMDISNFYLMTPLLHPKYIRIKFSNLPQEIIHQYKLNNKANKNGMVFVDINKSIKLVPGLWRHMTHPVQFVLTIDDFGVKYVSREHAEHL
ncbi:hypothetical protein ACHAW6_001397 [Cyclotella cf. meneghiniana]